MALETIEGITPPELAPWVTKHGYHLYCLKYNSEGFGGKSRQEFVDALSAEGVPCSIGYRSPLSEEPGMAHVGQKYPHLIRSLPCPNAVSVCEQSVWLFQNPLARFRGGYGSELSRLLPKSTERGIDFL